MKGVNASAFIRSSIKNDAGEDEKIEYSLPAEYSFSDGEAQIRYRETTEGGELITEISVAGGETAVTRRGAVSSKIVFCEDKPHSSLYSVGEFSFDMRVTTKKIRATLAETGGRLDILYKMTVGGADKDVHFGVRIEVNEK